MSEQINCRNCHELIPYRSKTCPSCGIRSRFQKKERVKDRVILVVAGIVVVLLAAMVLGMANAYIGIFK
ncbi:hypothetical protein BsIDN1_56660 [Bacillus safensis]|uniref:DUF2116 family Zn-ribbon domain-containing protein n=1 Tax=Bacillus safensis TaxID=561879 RepID=A0A5S9MG69_BACIA|nr:hypothetical protein BsIDN1_56660 [Bacillus safensis]